MKLRGQTSKTEPVVEVSSDDSSKRGRSTVKTLSKSAVLKTQGKVILGERKGRRNVVKKEAKIAAVPQSDNANRREAGSNLHKTSRNTALKIDRAKQMSSRAKTQPLRRATSRNSRQESPKLASSTTTPAPQARRKSSLKPASQASPKAIIKSRSQPSPPKRQISKNISVAKLSNKTRGEQIVRQNRTKSPIKSASINVKSAPIHPIARKSAVLKTSTTKKDVTQVVSTNPLVPRQDEMKKVMGGTKRRIDDETNAALTLLQSLAENTARVALALEENSKRVADALESLRGDKTSTPLEKIEAQLDFICAACKACVLGVDACGCDEDGEDASEGSDEVGLLNEAETEQLENKAPALMFLKRRKVLSAAQEMDTINASVITATDMEVPESDVVDQPALEVPDIMDEREFLSLPSAETGDVEGVHEAAIAAAEQETITPAKVTATAETESISVDNEGGEVTPVAALAQGEQDVDLGALEVGAIRQLPDAEVTLNQAVIEGTRLGHEFASREAREEKEVPSEMIEPIPDSQLDATNSIELASKEDDATGEEALASTIPIEEINSQSPIETDDDDGTYAGEMKSDEQQILPSEGN